jgi:hypothetical protein
LSFGLLHHFQSSNPNLEGDSTVSAWVGIAAVVLLVMANGFFVATEFSLVAVRRSRVVDLVS